MDCNVCRRFYFFLHEWCMNDFFYYYCYFFFFRKRSSRSQRETPAVRVNAPVRTWEKANSSDVTSGTYPELLTPPPWNVIYLNKNGIVTFYGAFAFWMQVFFTPPHPVLVSFQGCWISQFSFLHLCSFKVTSTDRMLERVSSAFVMLDFAFCLISDCYWVFFSVSAFVFNSVSKSHLIRVYIRLHTALWKIWL